MTPAGTGLVDVVVVTHRSADELPGAVGALSDAAIVRRLIIVDNASTDGSAEVARRFTPHVVANPVNAGFGVAVDQGAALGSAPYLLLLNPDARLDPSGLELLVDAMEADPRLGAVSPRLRHPDGSEQRVAWPFTTSGDAWAEALGRHRVGRAGRGEAPASAATAARQGEVTPVDGFLIGACLLVRREAFVEVGGFDPRYWLYGEEADLQARMADRGWTRAVVPAVVAGHVGGASGSGMDAVLLEHRQRGDERFVLDREGPAGVRSLRLARLTGSALRSVAPVRSEAARERRDHHRARARRTLAALVRTPGRAALDRPAAAWPPLPPTAPVDGPPAAGPGSLGGDLVVCSLEPWDDVWRRNQFLVRELCDRDPLLRVLFVEPPADLVHRALTGQGPVVQRGLRPVHAAGRVLAVRPSKVWPRVLGPFADRSLRRQVERAARRAGLDRPLVWVNDLHHARTGEGEGWPRLYDLTDDWLDAGLSERERRRLERLEGRLLGAADAVTACSPALVARKSSGGTAVELVPNAADVDLLRRPTSRPGAMPPGPTLVYVGTLHVDRLDVELTAALAAAGLRGPDGRPATVVLVGPDALGPEDRARLDAAGVVRTGPVPHTDVPAWLGHADVIVVPHVVSPFTESLDPLKAHECAAVGRPTVATPVAGFRELAATSPVVQVADRERFVDAVAATLARPVPAGPGPLAPGVVTWGERAGAMAAALVRARRHAAGADLAAPSGPTSSTGSAVRRRVVAVDHCARPSGAEICLERIVAATDADVHVVLAEDGPLVERLCAVGATVEVRDVDERARSAARDARPGPAQLLAALGLVREAVALRRHLVALAPDVVHVNSVKAALYGGLAARAAGLPLVWHLHEPITADHLPARLVEPMRRLARRLPDLVVANSAATAASLAPGTAVRVVPCPLPPGALERPVVERPDGEPLVVGMLGRLTPWKGQHVFLEAFARAFPDPGPDGGVRALVVGSALFADAGGPEATYPEALRRLAARLGVEDRVTFTGFVDDVAGVLDAVDVVVHASVRPEPFGQVLVEAMAAGRPVVASAAGGPLEVLHDGIDGLLVPPGDVDALAGALRRLAADPSARARMGAAGRQAAARYRPERVGGEVEDAWTEAVARRDERAVR